MAKVKTEIKIEYNYALNQEKFLGITGFYFNDTLSPLVHYLGMAANGEQSRSEIVCMLTLLFGQLGCRALYHSLFIAESEDAVSGPIFELKEPPPFKWVVQKKDKEVFKSHHARDPVDSWRKRFGGKPGKK
jgi:hypothetical protein